MTRRALLYLVVAVLSASDRSNAQSGPTAPGKVRATEVSTDHLKIRYTSDVRVQPKETASLVVEVEPRQGMHVYAPGADEYQVITITLTAHDGVQPRPTKYPPSEMYLFAPLNEQIPVYQKPFKLVTDAVVVNTNKTVALKGHLDYQACDDKVCFAPVRVPLSWNISR